MPCRQASVTAVTTNISGGVMDKQVQEAAGREVDKAISADEQASAHYYDTLRRFISDKSTEPEARLDSAGLKEIDTAWLKLNGTNKNLRRAYMKLYSSYL
jgi:hypothetical protein